MAVFIDKLKNPAQRSRAPPMSLFLSKQFIPSPAEPGPAKWHTSEYPRAATSRISCIRSLQFRISLWPLARGPSIVGTPSHPSHTGADQNDRLPPGGLKLAYQTCFHCIIGSQPKWWASIVSSGVSPNDVHLTARRAPVRLGWLDLSNMRLPCCRAPVGLAYIGIPNRPWPKYTAPVWLVGLDLSNWHPCGWYGLTCQTGTRRAGLNWFAK